MATTSGKQTMVIGRAISLFLIDGVPDGRIACELFNWTGKAVKIPRRLLKESANRTDLQKAGVYFLFGRDEARNEISSVYIGEAEDVIARVPQHQDKDFWTEALVFVSKDDNLNKAHIKFLESTIYDKAREVGRYKLQNGNTPNCPMISEMERAVMTEFFENLQLLVGSLGYKIFEPLISPTTTAAEEYTIAATRGANAKAVFTNDGMVVLKGSIAAGTEVPSSPEYVLKTRKQFLEEGIFETLDGNFVFTQDYLFATPSGAAGVVLGRSANGWIEWKDRQNRTLKENEE